MISNKRRLKMEAHLKISKIRGASKLRRIYKISKEAPQNKALIGDIKIRGASMRYQIRGASNLEAHL
jgi:hypothetical protein